MDRLTNLYAHIICSPTLGYISVKSPTITKTPSLKPELVSFPGILNIFPCISTCISFIVLWNTFQALKFPSSNYMLLMMALVVNVASVILVRLISAKTSGDFLQTFARLQHWAPEYGWTRRGRKIIWLMVALITGSILCALYMSIVILFTAIHEYPATGAALLEAWTVLYWAAYLSAVFTDITAIPFAVSYVVILGSHIVDTYKCMSKAVLRNNFPNTKETWKIKKRFKLLK